MPKPPYLPEKRINVSLLDGDGEQLLIIRDELEKDGVRRSWAEVIRHAIQHTSHLIINKNAI